MILLDVSKTSAARPSYISSISCKALERREMFEHTFIRTIYKVSISSSQKAPCVSITKTARLMSCNSQDIRWLFPRKQLVYIVRIIQNLITLCEQGAEMLNATRRGGYSNHSTLKCYRTIVVSFALTFRNSANLYSFVMFLEWICNCSLYYINRCVIVLEKRCVYS
jgi:hypothetical protein